MKLFHRVGLPFAIAGCLASQPAASQIVDLAQGRPAAATGTDAAAQTPPAKPAMLEFDVPAGIIGPARDSIKRQIDSPSSRTRDISVTVKPESAPPANESVPSRGFTISSPAVVEPSLPVTTAVPPAPAAPAMPAAASREPGTVSKEPAAAAKGPAAVVKEPAVTAKEPAVAKDTVVPPISMPTLRLADLKRLDKQEILLAATDKFAAYILKGNERTVVLDFPTTLAQARMFGRVILFVERDGTSKSRVMTVPEVKKWLEKNAKTLDTLTMGNNIRVSEFARFFNTARFQGEPLTSDELDLYNWLVQMKLLREEEIGVAVVEPEAIIISVPQVSTVQGCAPCSVTAEHRLVTIEHEFSHARFATDVPYQNYVLWFWTQGMNPVARGKFTQFLRKRGYDVSIRELAANEMQAFLMHTPNAAAFNATDVGMTETELADLRRSFQAGLMPKPQVTIGKAYRLE